MCYGPRTDKLDGPGLHSPVLLKDSMDSVSNLRSPFTFSVKIHFVDSCEGGAHYSRVRRTRPTSQYAVLFFLRPILANAAVLLFQVADVSAAGACVSLIVSKLLGFAVIAGSVGVKVPQISKIWNSKSAQGVSNSMFQLELIG